MDLHRRGNAARSRRTGECRRQFERAAKLVGAAEAIMEAQYTAWPPDERPHYERLLAELPEAMGENDFQRARSHGQAMEIGDAIRLALGSLASDAPGSPRPTG